MVANSSDSTTACELIYGFAPFILTIDFYSVSLHNRLLHR